ADWLCAYDEAAQVLTIGQTLFSDNWHAIVATLAVLRRLGGFLPAAGGAQGLVLVHDWIFGHRGTLAAVALGAGGSGLLAAVPDAPARIAAALGPVREAVAAGQGAPLRDDLDALAAGGGACGRFSTAPALPPPAPSRAMPRAMNSGAW